MKIGICLRESSYLPEAYAYREYLTSNNFKIELGYEHELSKDLDIKLKFLGYSFHYFKKIDKCFIPEIHEYSSISVPPFAKIKDLMKSHLNTKPIGRIFLNEVVKQRFQFCDNIPYILRDMGIDKKFFHIKNEKHEYDVIYCGIERDGLIEAILKLLSYNLKILIVGNFSKDFKTFFSNNGNILFTGKVERNLLPELYRKCRMGLNFTPDIYPFNIQTSTKTLEYCAAGLGVISNRYNWVEKFMISRNANFLWIEDIISNKSIEQFNFIVPDVSDLEWNKVLDNSSLKIFIESFSRNI